MREQTEQDIIRYIEYLRETGYMVVLSCPNRDYLKKSIPLLQKYEIHPCDVCVFLKSHPQMKARCIKNKRLLEASKNTNAVYDSCWAGVEEWVFPIVVFDQLICRIHISGYRGKLKNSKRRSALLVKKMGEKFSASYALLSKKVPTRESLLRVIMPLQYMFEALVRENLADCYKTDSAIALYPNMLEYIYNHYQEDIKVDDMARALGYSPSYLSSVFRKMNGHSIMEYVNIVRVTSGADLLCFTNLPISEITFECGFRESTYFSTAFKKFYKMSPREYRSQNAKRK